jgi:two-component system sensor histidine kinase KdpD
MRERLLAVRRGLAPPSPLGVGLAAAGLVVSTLLTAVLQGPLGVRNAEIVYLLAVVAVGLGYGSWYAVGTAIVSFLVYDFFFIKPLYTFQVGSAEQWLDLVLFLVVAIAIGHISALQLQRRREAELRTSEARALFAMSRDIATTATAHEAAPAVVSRLAREAQMTRVWIGLGPSIGEERIVADSSPEEPRLPISPRWVLHSVGADSKPAWSRVHDAALVPRPGPDAKTVLRVPVSVGGEQLGSLWACRCAGEPFPGRSHSRLMAAAADQFGQAVMRDRLAAEATAAEVARQGDALKSALLDSVSHDLRTPLAAIRATAGHLMDPGVPWSAEAQRHSAESIDREADRLSKLVRNMLDLGRIEGGALRPALELYSLADLVETSVQRALAGADAPAIEVDVRAGLPAVRVDAIFVDQILTNLIDNSVRHAGHRPVRISARARREMVDLVVEDGGPGVSQAEMSRIFDRFYRAAAQASRAAGGSGIGLAVVKGLTEAMGGKVAARRSRLGGLAVVVSLPVGDEAEPGRPDEPADDEVGPTHPTEPAEAPDGTPVEADE